MKHSQSSLPIRSWAGLHHVCSSSISKPFHFLDVILFNQIDFDPRQLTQFINRTPKFWTPHDKAYIHFDHTSVEAKLTYRTLQPGHASSRIMISCKEPDWQISSIAQVCNSS